MVQKSASSKSQFLISIIQKPMVSSHGSMPKILIKSVLFTLILILFNSCVNKERTIEERIIPETKQYLSFTWEILSKTWSIWVFNCLDKKEKSYECFSKKEDLSYLLWEEYFIKWVYEFWKLEILDTQVVEKEIIKEPFEYKNSSWWYGFFADTEKFSVIKWWSKTIVKNLSWVILLNIFSYSNDKIPQDAFISNWWNIVEINWINWEVKNLDKWFELWLKNSENWYLVNLNIAVWEDEWNDSLIVKSVLDTFKFVDRKVKWPKLECWWVDNIVCPEWYFCELSDTWNKWKCVLIWN